MKTIIYPLLLLMICGVCVAQSTEAYPTKSRFYNNRYKSFSIKQNDILVYTIKNDTTPYNLVLTVLQKDSNGITLGYSIESMGKHGIIFMPKQTVKFAPRYDTLIMDPTTILQNEMIAWLSNKNFKELYYVKESLMNMGNGIETFERGNTSVMKLKVKGRESIYTLYNIENKKNDSAKSMAVLTNSQNPLIVSMDTGKWSMQLQEIR